MRLLITLVVFTLLVSGCGGSNDAGSASEPAVSTATTSSIDTLTDTVSGETDADDSGGFTGVFADTYEAARLICRGSGVAAIAEEFGSASEPAAAARAYANNLSNEGSRHHDASYAGCLRGLGEHE